MLVLDLILSAASILRLAFDLAPGATLVWSLLDLLSLELGFATAHPVTERGLGLSESWCGLLFGFRACFGWWP